MPRTLLVDKLHNCSRLCRELLVHSEVGLDLEGVELCRSGEVGLLQVCTAAGDVFLFDIASLGHDAFMAGGLKAVLESQSVCKVVFDGRADADALYHIYGVMLRNVYDLQVHHSLRHSDPNDRFVKGLQRCLQDAGVVPVEDRSYVERVKDSGKRLFAREMGGQIDIWVQRPMPELLFEYAAVDVRYLIPVMRAWAGTASLLVLSLTRDRLEGAVHGPKPARGEHMSVRDFSLGTSARYLGHAAVPESSRCLAYNLQRPELPSSCQASSLDLMDDSSEDFCYAGALYSGCHSAYDDYDECQYS